MDIKSVINHLETFAPLSYAESFDNVGLLVGNAAVTLTGILVTLDTLESVVEEAIAKKCNLIVSFHPIIFKGLQKITGNTYVERVVMKALKHDIAIYAIHTALDNMHLGVNHGICEKLGLQNSRILIPQPATIKKLITYVPEKSTDHVLKALFDAGAGTIGNYDECSFKTTGQGSFKPNDLAKPTEGTPGKTTVLPENQLSITFPKHREGSILKALRAAHPYEEIAYEISTLENNNQQIGMGMIGSLPAPMDEKKCLQWIKKSFHSGGIRHSEFRNKPIKSIAVLGGSGSFAIPYAKQQGADLLITADLKYHDYFQAEGSIVLADIGHYESEQFTKNLIIEFLRKKISNFAIVLSDTNTNPIKYL